MSSISFSGIATGIDTDTMISQLISVESTKITLLEETKSAYQTQISTVQDLNSKLQSMQSLVEDLSTIDGFLSYETTTSDSDYVTVSASGSANPGTYSIDVNKLATAERRYSSAFSAEDEAGLFGEGTLTITIDDGDDDTVDTAEIEIDSTDTLEDVVSKINSTSLSLSAGILYDGSSYYLQVSGKVTGDEHGISITEGGTLNLGINDTDANIVQNASDAEFEMDGFVISSDSNSVTSAIPGVTINLQEVTEVDEPVNITISPNTDAVVEKLQSFVDSYNEISTLIHDQFSFDGEAKSQSYLTGDSTLRSVQIQLSQMVSSIVDDLPGNIKSLSQIGIRTDTDGNLSIDTDDIRAAIADDPMGVAQLFSGTADHSVDGLADKFDTLIESFVNYSEGLLTSKISGLNSKIDMIDETIENQEDYLDSYEEKLRSQFTAMEITISSLNSMSSYLASV